MFRYWTADTYNTRMTNEDPATKVQRLKAEHDAAWDEYNRLLEEAKACRGRGEPVPRDTLRGLKQAAGEVHARMRAVREFLDEIADGNRSDRTEEE